MTDKEYYIDDMQTSIGVEVYIVYDDPRYPTLCLRDKNGNIVGYTLNLSTLELERCCICAAHSDDECICGYKDKDY